LIRRCRDISPSGRQAGLLDKEIRRNLDPGGKLLGIFTFEFGIVDSLLCLHLTFSPDLGYKIKSISKSVILKLAFAVFQAKPYKTAFFEVAISKSDILKSPQ
jgi:hypothetical protein